MRYEHNPVMLKEVLEYLKPQPGQNYIDCTLGGAGYTLAIAKKILPTGKILSIDLDDLALTNAKQLIIINKYLSAQAGKNIILVNENFRNLSKIVDQYFTEQPDIKFNGIIFDLGLSSAQLQDKTRGFSFRLDSPLIMNFSQQSIKNRRESTEFIINNYKQGDLARIIWLYGEERFANQIAKKIIETRRFKPITTTGQLVEIIKSVIPKRFQHKDIHPATKTFQALRIATNDELNNLEQALPQAVNLLKSRGKLIVISYHSLEDRIVKNFFRQESRDCICPPIFPACRCQHQARLKILTPKVIKPSQAEILKNNRARSAKLRATERIN